MNFPDARLWDDFCLFARAQVLSGDIEPMHAVLKRYYAGEKLDPETALWRTLLFLTWFHVGSAEKVWRRHPKPTAIDPVGFASLAVGVERRSFRGVVGNVQARAFIDNVRGRANGKLAKWVGTFGAGEAGWRSARRELEAIPGAGAWASMTWAELLRAVHGLPLICPDIGANWTSGAVPVLAKLTGKPPRVVAADTQLQQAVLDAAVKRGVPLDGFDQLRSVLMNFARLLKGSYYVGHDIDAQMAALEGSGPELWEARAAFPAAYRGERAKTPWSGVRRDLSKVYVQRGELVNLWV